MFSVLAEFVERSIVKVEEEYLPTGSGHIDLLRLSGAARLSSALYKLREQCSLTLSDFQRSLEEDGKVERAYCLRLLADLPRYLDWFQQAYADDFMKPNFWRPHELELSIYTQKQTLNDDWTESETERPTVATLDLSRYLLPRAVDLPDGGFRIEVLSEYPDVYWEERRVHVPDDFKPDDQDQIVSTVAERIFPKLPLTSVDPYVPDQLAPLLEDQTDSIDQMKATLQVTESWIRSYDTNGVMADIRYW